MTPNLSPREEAEAIDQFGMDLIRLVRQFDKLCARMSPGAIDAINSIPDQQHLTTIAGRFLYFGDRLCRACDEAEEAEDRRRDNPLEPDFRRLGQ